MGEQFQAVITGDGAHRNADHEGRKPAARRSRLIRSNMICSPRVAVSCLAAAVTLCTFVRTHPSVEQFRRRVKKLGTAQESRTGEAASATPPDGVFAEVLLN